VKRVHRIGGNSKPAERIARGGRVNAGLIGIDDHAITIDLAARCERNDQGATVPACRHAILRHPLIA